MLDQIVSLWIAGPLSRIERLSLSSFVQAGHPIALYLYRDVTGVPDGVDIRDANVILPWSKVQSRLGDEPSPSLVADWFRLLLMRREAGIWVDADVVCIRPIRLADEMIAGWESDAFVNTAVLRLGRNNPILVDLLRAFDACRVPEWVPFRRGYKAHIRQALTGSVGPASLPRATFGPRGLTALAAKHGLLSRAMDRDVFYPLHPRNAGRLFEAVALSSVLTDRCLTVHLWNEKISHRKAAPVPAGSMLAELMQRYAVSH